VKGNLEQPMQRCMAERPEVSRGHSTGKGDDPCRGCTSGTGRAEQRSLTSERSVNGAEKAENRGTWLPIVG